LSDKNSKRFLIFEEPTIAASMSKKNKWAYVPFIFIALLLIILIVVIFKKPSGPADPINAIPVNASVIIKVNDFNALHEKTSAEYKIWQQLRNLPLLNRIDKQIVFIDSLMKNVPDIEKILDNPPYFISAHFTGNEKISLFHVFRLPAGISGRKVTDFISSLIVNSGTVTVRKYEGTDIHEVALLNQSKVNNFSFAVRGDILMISFSTTVLEDAVRQLNQGNSLMSVSGFTTIYATAGKNVDANVFVNFNEFPRTLSAFVKSDFKSEVRSCRNFADWAELDVNPLSDMLLMNGFVNTNDSVKTMASVLLSQNPQRMTVDQVLPSTVASFLSLTITDPAKYISEYEDFLREQGRLTAYKNTLQSLNNAYGTNFPEDFTGIMENEIAMAFDGGTDLDSVRGSYFVMRIKSKTQTEQKISSILASMARVESKPVSEYISTYKLDEDLSFRIMHLPVRKLAAKVFGGLFTVPDEQYVTVLDNYLVIAGSEESLKSLIHNFVLNKTLEHDAAFGEFRNNLSPRSNLCFYVNLSKSQPFYSPFLKSTLGKAWNKNMPVFQNVQLMGLQLYASNKMLYSNFLVRHLSSVSTTAQTVWESRLDTLTDFKPVFVLNHQTGQNEVFVQDLNNTIYLVNHVGRILWKQRLPDRINSEVFQIDYFRNGKLQLMFSTRNQIYLVDRNGNFVERYPITLRSPATNGLAVFDYEGNRDYRLFIACEDKYIYAYDRQGTLVQGWAFGQSESEVTRPLNHFRIGARDFIVFGDRYKTYILDRKGNTRVSVDTYFPVSGNNDYVLNVSGDDYSPSVVTTDTTGKVYFIGFTGNVKTADLGTYSGSHYFDYKDLTGDNKPEFIYMDDKKMTVLNNNQSKLFTVKFDEPVSSKPQYYQFTATDKKLGVVLRSKNLIYLINNDGSLYNGFPLQGNTPFSIGDFGDSLSRFNLVVGSRDNFLYNYRVQ
jgi:hypothetical protein